MTGLAEPARVSRGLGRSPPQDHVLRNHSVGSTCTLASRDDRLCTVMRHMMSSGAAFAYSTSTSKYRPSSKMPVSTSSYSSSCRDRARFTATRSSYGNSACGYLYSQRW